MSVEKRFVVICDGAVCRSPDALEDEGPWEFTATTAGLGRLGARSAAEREGWAHRQRRRDRRIVDLCPNCRLDEGEQ